MRLARSLAAVAAVSPDAFEDPRRNIDPEWVVQALEATGMATVRSRRLPAEQVVWLVIGMALFRNRSIHEVVGKLRLAPPSNGPTAAPSSVAQARAHLGPDPMEWRFAISAEHWRMRALAAIIGAGWRCTASTARRCGCPTRGATPGTSVTRTASGARASIPWCAAPD
jgi:hypothetical protein